MRSFSSMPSAPLQIQITLSSPRVSLDHSVLAILARNTDQPCRFRKVLARTNGTLMLSWAHVIELFALGKGPTFERVRCYLRSFGGRDRKWARRCLNFQLPEKAAAIFDGSEIDHLLESLSLATSSSQPEKFVTASPRAASRGCWTPALDWTRPIAAS